MKSCCAIPFRRLFALLLAALLLIGLMPAPAFARDEAEEITLPLLKEELQIYPLDAEEAARGTLYSEEVLANSFNRPEEGIKGKRLNLVGLFRFAGEEEYRYTPLERLGGLSFDEVLPRIYEEGPYSVKAYYLEQSYGELDFESVILPLEGSLELDHPRSYYQPLTPENPEGYVRHVRQIRIFDRNGEPTPDVAALPEAPCFLEDGSLEEHLMSMEEYPVLLCPHLGARIDTAADGSLNLVVWLDDTSGDNHSWSASSCAQSDEYAIRAAELQSDIMTKLGAAAEAAGIADVDCASLWLSGDSGDWQDILWPMSSSYQPFLDLFEAAETDSGDADFDAAGGDMADGTDAGTDADTAGTADDDAADREEAIAWYRELAGEEVWEAINRPVPAFSKNPEMVTYQQTFVDFPNYDEVLIPGYEELVFNLGTTSHELGHVLGFPDYYSYMNNAMPTMGYWSLMCDTNSPAQYLHTYARYYYGGWLSEKNIPLIDQEGEYTLHIVSGSGREDRDAGEIYALRLLNPASPEDTPEQIVLEYRGRRGAFERTGAGIGRARDGLILYSVDDEADRALAGNMGAGEGGPFGAKLYTIAGSGRDYAPEWADSYCDLYTSVLTDRTNDLGYFGQLPAYTSYGSIDPGARENALISWRTGENSGIVITGVYIHADDPDKISFYVDLKAPMLNRVEETLFRGRAALALTFDEPMLPGESDPFLVEADGSQRALESMTYGNQLIIELAGAPAGAEIRIPAGAVADRAGRAMAAEIRFVLGGGEAENENAA